MSPEKKKNKNEEKDEILTDETIAEMVGEIEPTELDLIKELETRLSDHQDKYLRLLAEYDNYRKRTQAEKEGIYSDAFCTALSNFLPIFDNLDRAVASENGEGLKKGLELIMKQVGDVYDRLGIAEIPAEGEQFDPNLHDAVLHVEDDNAGANEIVEVLQKGYTLKDRVVRHSMVKVAN